MVGLEPQPMHIGMVYNLASTQDFGSNSQIWANKCGGNGMVMDQSAFAQHMNIVKHIVHA
jgi:hypothetical protein